ncbi:MAG: HlyD family efflux transporter periplasmic adaptor subunit [Clostridiales bacterium]|nr:HlyD family efflux transporter periplasmic adaptor subunit [Clostridiales bacterium]
MSDVKEEKKAKRSGKKKRKILRRLIALVLVLGVLGLAGFIVVRKLQADYRVTYDPYTAAIGSISNSLSYSGSMQLINNTTYTATAESKVREVYVAAGDKVKEGDKLVRLSDGTTLTADFDGTVNKVDVEKGDEVRGNSSLVQVVDFDHMQVSFRVGESDIREVAPGMSVRVTVSSISQTFDAVIDSIDYSSYSGNNVAYYTAVVKVDTSSVDYIYPGMQATVTIPQEEAKDVVILKMDAISTAADNTAFVYKQEEDGTMTETPVTVGVSNGNYVEIKAGVSDGETVYVVKKQEESTVGGILSGLFGSQQVNMPSGGGMPGGGSFGGGDFSGFPGGSSDRPSGGSNSGTPGSRNRGN